MWTLLSVKKCASSVQFTNYNICSPPQTFFSTKEHSGDRKIQIHTNFPKCYNFTIIKAQQTYLLVTDSLLNDVISNSGYRWQVGW
jgi:hypothetical protein